MAGPLETVVRLQRALADLQRAERQLAGVPEWMEELHAEHSARRLEIDAQEAAAAEAERNRRRAEAATEDAEARLAHFQQQVRQVRTQREYAALLSEIDTVKSQIKTLEETALAELEAQDRARAHLDEQRAGFAELDAKYRQALARWEQEKPAVAQQAETLRDAVRRLREELPRHLLSLFDRILERRLGEALAPLRRVETPGSEIWACSACNYRVRLQVVSDIKSHGALVQCDGCKRILVVEDEGGVP